MKKVPSRISLLILLGGLWLIIGFRYMTRTRDFVRTHDFKSQLVYTATIAFEHRLPNASECWEWRQPPLYYWLASHALPSNPVHPSLVRLCSLFLGALAVSLIFYLLITLNIPAVIAFGTTLFISTTPQYMYVFSTYNNDSLSTFLSMLVVWLSLSYVSLPNRTIPVLLFLSALLGVYAKSTVFNVLLILGALTAGAWAAGRLPSRKASGLLAIYAGVMALYLPWIFLRLYLPSGSLFGAMEDVRGLEVEKLQLPVGPWHSLFTLPGLSQEWHTPFVNMWEMIHTKKSSFLSYHFATSLYGEFEYWKPSLWVIWGIVAVHGLLSLGALAVSWHSWRNRMALGVILLATASYAIIVITCPLCPSMDFRYVAWTWVAWAVLYADLWEKTARAESRHARLLAPGAMWIGILLHIYFLFTAQSYS